LKPCDAQRRNVARNAATWRATTQRGTQQRGEQRRNVESNDATWHATTQHGEQHGYPGAQRRRATTQRRHGLRTDELR
jgi:hypothetical protein